LILTLNLLRLYHNYILHILNLKSLNKLLNYNNNHIQYLFLSWVLNKLFSQLYFLFVFKKNEIVETIVLSFEIIVFNKKILKYNSISCENRANQRYLNPIRYGLVLIYLKIGTLWLKLYNFLLQNDFNIIKYSLRFFLIVFYYHI
jgi:hypothetical protein